MTVPTPPAQSPESWRAEFRAAFRRPRNRRQALRLLAWGVLAFGLVAPLIRLATGYDAIAFPVTLAAALAALLWVAPRSKEIRTWAFYIVSIYFFTQLRDAADETSIQSSTQYVLDWELWTFGGITPSAWLQDNLGGGSGDPGGVAYASAVIHWSWFIFPHAVVVSAFFFARPMFFRVAAIMAGIFFFAVAIYYLVPTVPPWLAAEEGATTGIVRIMNDVGPTFIGKQLWNDLFALFAEPNARAAMPSLHFAASFMVIVIALLIRSPRLLVIGTIYSMGLAFALIYLGEHYFVDILAGAVAALAAVFLVETALGNGPGIWLWNRWRPGKRLPPLPPLSARSSEGK